MKFNQFMWDTFLDSTRGKEAISFFRNFKEYYFEKEKQKYLLEFINNRYYKIDSDEINNHIEWVKWLYTIIPEVYENNITSFDDAEKLLEIIWSLQDEEDKRLLNVNSIPEISIVLYLYYPDFFFPYYYSRHFFNLVEMFKKFGIFLPKVPKKSNMEERFFYYLDLCKSIKAFGQNYHMSSEEIPAFFYFFAINFIIDPKNRKELPDANRAFFIGGGKKNSDVDASGDFDYLDNAKKEDYTGWQGNPETEIGDILVMYCLSPRSYIHSIWRAIAPGSIDPFFYFYRSIWIGNPIKVKHISINEIKSDPVLSEMPLVKGNMQGINGRPINKLYYDRILEILSEKGQDISLLPKLETQLDTKDISIKSERDVEKKLLEPFLVKLGFKKDNWLRQMPVRMGRGERIYPDYVIFPVTEKGNESGKFIWEAKHNILNNKQLKDDFFQAKSYALRLKTRGLGLVSVEGVWISLEKENLDFSRIKFYSWKQLQEVGYLNELRNIIGYKTLI